MTSLKPTARNLVSIVFIVLSLGSSVYILASTANYLHFFPALDSIQARVGSAYFNRGTSGLPYVSANITIDNPSDYQGFNLVRADVRISFTNSTSSLLQNLPLQGQQPKTSPLGPHSSISEYIAIIMNTDNATALDSFVRNSASPVRAQVLLTAQIGTFFDPVIGNSQVSQTADLPLTV
jgi:hypothetical protein